MEVEVKRGLVIFNWWRGIYYRVIEGIRMGFVRVYRSVYKKKS